MLSRTAIPFRLVIPERRFLRRPRNTARDENPLKVTIDSTEPLVDALRVLGALYNVDIAEVVASDDTSPGPAAQDRPVHAATAKASRRAPAKTSKATSEKRSTPAQRSAPVSSSDIRAWAIANGHAVRGRGTLPTAIKTAYVEAHKR